MSTIPYDCFRLLIQGEEEVEIPTPMSSMALVVAVNHLGEEVAPLSWVATEY